MMLVTLSVMGMIIVSGYGINDEILSYSRSQMNDGYHFGYITSGGQTREEQGKLEQKGDNLILRVIGSYSYRGSDGRLYRTSYRADEGGFRADGNIIPKPGNDFPDSDSNFISRGSSTGRNETSESPQIVTKPGMESEQTTSVIDLTTPVPFPEYFAPPPAGISSAALASLAGGGLG